MGEKTSSWLDFNGPFLVICEMQWRIFVYLFIETFMLTDADLCFMLYNLKIPNLKIKSIYLLIFIKSNYICQLSNSDKLLRNIGKQLVTILIVIKYCKCII